MSRSTKYLAAVCAASLMVSSPARAEPVTVTAIVIGLGKILFGKTVVTATVGGATKGATVGAAHVVATGKTGAVATGVITRKAGAGAIKAGVPVATQGIKQMIDN